MYGFGSKEKLLEDSAGSELKDGAAVVVNGYLSNVNIKHVKVLQLFISEIVQNVQNTNQTLFSVFL
jgi:hypothetical protein